ncbi:MAG: response regulator [Phycisphaerales bacterium]|nr:response regulator [Phycisphaerales bacterium]
MLPDPTNLQANGKTQLDLRKQGPPRILLAEDDREMRSLLTETLSRAGYMVEALEDGLELMDQLAEYLAPEQHKRVDLIISDLRMPWVDGMEVLRTIGRYIGYPRMILITAFGDDEVHAEAKRLGAAAVMNKPFDVDALLARVREIIPNESGTDDAELSR